MRRHEEHYSEALCQANAFPERLVPLELVLCSSSGGGTFLESQIYYGLPHKNDMLLKLRSKQEYWLRELFVSEMIETYRAFSMAYTE